MRLVGIALLAAACGGGASDRGRVVAALRSGPEDSQDIEIRVVGFDAAGDLVDLPGDR